LDGNVIRYERTRDDGTSETVFIGVVSEVRPDGDVVHIELKTPEWLLGTMPLPFAPPGTEFVGNPTPFAHWWRQLAYVFALPSPYEFPSLRRTLTDSATHVLERFASVTEALARSSLMVSPGRMSVRVDDDTDELIVNADEPPADHQAGFAALLRQCHEPKEPASYRRVHGALWVAAEAADAATRDAAQEVLTAWGDALRTLRTKSVGYLVGEAFSEREGWRALLPDPQPAPEVLISTFHYGDLIHWGTRQSEVRSSDEEAFDTARRRSLYLAAVLGVAHAYVGFGRLVESALEPHE
jgi:hypothetical protein